MAKRCYYSAGFILHPDSENGDVFVHRFQSKIQRDNRLGFGHKELSSKSPFVRRARKSVAKGTGTWSCGVLVGKIIVRD